MASVLSVYEEIDEIWAWCCRSLRERDHCKFKAILDYTEILSQNSQSRMNGSKVSGWVSIGTDFKSIKGTETKAVFLAQNSDLCLFVW